MKRMLVILLLMLTACAVQKTVEEPDVKKELSFLQVLRYKAPGETLLTHEDKWYLYDAKFDYVVKGEFDNANMMYGSCPIAKADYKVTDKETRLVIREATYNQWPCDPCHAR
ncbi:MAG: hypothetical protein HY956_09945 [Deltaproteobacteria bacterium]|nr:hypothetical protein [Deltaproteobacteria bacterium]